MKFKVEFQGEIELEIDDYVLLAIDDSWKRTFYNLDTREKIAEHIAFNMVANKLKLSQMDGFADLRDKLVQSSGIEWDEFLAEVVD